MKPSKFKTLSFIISLTGSFSIIFFGLPIWTFFLLIPGLIYSQLLIAHNYSFRDSISLEPIPHEGYEKRLIDLEENQTLYTNSNFAKFDEFYMQTSNDIVAFAYQHKELPIIACNYDFELFKVFDFDTKFEEGFKLTTTNTNYAHLLETSNEKMLQAFPEADFEELLQKHIQSIEFLKQQGLTPEETRLDLFRDEFLEEFLEQGQQFKGLLSPAISVYRMYFGNKYKYRKSVQEQFLAKSLLLP